MNIIIILKKILKKKYFIIIIFFKIIIKIMKRIETSLTRRNRTKFLNKTLFERREKERLNSGFLKTETNFNTTQYTRNTLEFPYLTTQTTLPTTERPYSKKNIRLNKFLCSRNPDSLNNTTTYLTNTPYLKAQSNRIKTNYTLDCLNDDNEKKDEKNLSILNTFENSRHLYNIKDNLIILSKNREFTKKKESIYDYIYKTRYYKLMKYTIGIKNERTIRLKEHYFNNNYEVDDIVNSIENTKKLFNEGFHTKFNDYVKELEIQREIEKTKNKNLLTQILKYKKELSQIESKIKKVEFEKNNIIRWIYFQIAIKEKKLRLPNYYKSIIEETDENMTKIFENPSNFSEEDKFERNKRIRDTKREGTRKPTRKSTSNLDKGYHLTPKNTKIGLYKNISLTEGKRIRDYKYNLCFASPEDFMDALKKYDTQTIHFIDYYNDLRNCIKELKEEKENIENEKKKQILSRIGIIREKEFELKIQKDKYILLSKEIDTIRKNLKNIYISKENKKNKEERKSIIQKSIIPSKKKIILYDFILKTYNTCLKIPIKEIINPENVIIKKINSKEEEMMDMLSKIEITLDYLFRKITHYSKGIDIYYDMYKRIYNTIERNRKLEKTRKQREEENEKFIKLKERVEERNNKTYFLPRKKTEIYSAFMIKKDVKKKLDESYIKDPAFKDFMYDNEDNNNDNI